MYKLYTDTLNEMRKKAYSLLFLYIYEMFFLTNSLQLGYRYDITIKYIKN